MKTNQIPPRPPTPEHHGRHVGRAVVAMPTPESLEAVRRWQFEQFMAQREVLVRASRRVRHYNVQSHRPVIPAALPALSILQAIAEALTLRLDGYFRRLPHQQESAGEILPFTHHHEAA